jgi:excisionase family DNA binding protein
VSSERKEVAVTEALEREIARLNDIAQVQQRLNVGRSKVFELIRTGRLRSVLIGKRRLVTEQSLREFIAQLDGDEE